MIHLGPLMLAWHRLTIGLGVFIGTFAAARWVEERDLPGDPLYTLTALLAVAGIVSRRIF